MPIFQLQARHISDIDPLGHLGRVEAYILGVDEAAGVANLLILSPGEYFGREAQVAAQAIGNVLSQRRAPPDIRRWKNSHVAALLIRKAAGLREAHTYSSGLGLKGLGAYSLFSKELERLTRSSSGFSSTKGVLERWNLLLSGYRLPQQVVASRSARRRLRRKQQRLVAASDAAGEGPPARALPFIPSAYPVLLVNSNNPSTESDPVEEGAPDQGLLVLPLSWPETVILSALEKICFVEQHAFHGVNNSGSGYRVWWQDIGSRLPTGCGNVEAGAGCPCIKATRIRYEEWLGVSEKQLKERYRHLPDGWYFKHGEPGAGDDLVTQPFDWPEKHSLTTNSAHVRRLAVQGLYSGGLRYRAWHRLYGRHHRIPGHGSGCPCSLCADTRYQAWARYNPRPITRG